MKKIIMIVGIQLLSAGCLTAQDNPPQDTTTRGYRSFFGSYSTEWYYCEPLLTGGTFTYRLVIGEDTTINSLNYKRIQKYRLHPQDTTDVVGFECDADVIMLLREDTVTGKLWYTERGVETLLVDMSLEEGDYFMGRTVQAIEYDTIGRKRITLEGLPSDFMLEGVGPEFPFGFPNLMICVFHDDNNLYTVNIDDTYYGCPINTGSCRSTCDPMGVDTVFHLAPIIYPNPCYSFFCVELSDESQISLYDALGHIVLQKITFAGKNMIDVASLPIGVYYIYIAAHGKADWYKIIKK